MKTGQRYPLPVRLLWIVQNWILKYISVLWRNCFRTYKINKIIFVFNASRVGCQTCYAYIKTKWVPRQKIKAGASKQRIPDVRHGSKIQLHVFVAYEMNFSFIMKKETERFPIAASGDPEFTIIKENKHTTAFKGQNSTSKNI